MLFILTTHESKYWLFKQCYFKNGITEAAQITASGMGAISSTILQLCQSNDHIVSSRTIYGGTYAFMKNYLPRFNISTSFVDITKLELVENAITKNTKILYCETVSNPLLEIADIRALSKLPKNMI